MVAAVRIVIGMGTGRSGSQSLSRLINSQPQSVCFHEINPACMKWAETPRTVLSMIAEFEAVLRGGPREVTIDYTSPDRDRDLGRLQALESVEVIGDVASYYLAYVPLLAGLDLDIRMPCLRRDKAATVASFIKTVRRPDNRPRTMKKRIKAVIKGKARPSRCNHWVEHDGKVWVQDRKWDKCFPKFEASTLEESIGLYWEHYMELSDEFAARYPEKFRVFDIEDLNSEGGQAAILDLCGFGDSAVLGKFHSNQNPN